MDGRCLLVVHHVRLIRQRLLHRSNVVLVDAIVLLQRIYLREAFVADLARVRLNPCVDAIVNVQVAGEGEPLVTVVAFVRFLIGMHFVMQLQIVQRCVHFIAI